jgi:hypothetical protein
MNELDSPALNILVIKMTCTTPYISPHPNSHGQDSPSQSLRFSQSALVRSSSVSMGPLRSDNISASNDCFASPLEASRPANISYGPPTTLPTSVLSPYSTPRPTDIEYEREMGAHQVHRSSCQRSHHTLSSLSQRVSSHPPSPPWSHRTHATLQASNSSIRSPLLLVSVSNCTMMEWKGEGEGWKVGRWGWRVR